jgi:hypothetical protein
MRFIAAPIGIERGSCCNACGSLSSLSVYLLRAALASANATYCYWRVVFAWRASTRPARRAARRWHVTGGQPQLAVTARAATRDLVHRRRQCGSIARTIIEECGHPAPSSRRIDSRIYDDRSACERAQSPGCARALSPGDHRGSAARARRAGLAATASPARPSIAAISIIAQNASDCIERIGASPVVVWFFSCRRLCYHQERPLIPLHQKIIDCRRTYDVSE